MASYEYHRSHISQEKWDEEDKKLEDYYDATLGVIVFSTTGLPTTECERFRSISNIRNAQLFRSKISDFSILRYNRGGQSVSVTLETKVNSCGRAMFKTGISNIEVLLLKENEEFLHAKHLDVENMEEEILLESEIRSSTTSVELALVQEHEC